VQQASSAPVDIVVAAGVYTPALIEAQAGTTVTLRFLREDPGPCAEKVIFADLGVSADLVVGVPRDVVITPAAPGDYEFTCQMGMYRGHLVVR
jgi:plastocyanin domain-containing protein